MANNLPYRKQHRLSHIDRDAMTARCVVCGPTKVVPHINKKHSHLVQCGVANEFQKKQKNFGNNAKAGDPDRLERKRDLYHSGHFKKKISSLYGVSEDWYDVTYAKQQGACAICGEARPNAWGKYCVDHDHTSGKVRGLLCNECNALLGFAKESPSTLEAAAEYLRAHK